MQVAQYRIADLLGIDYGLSLWVELIFDLSPILRTVG